MTRNRSRSSPAVQWFAPLGFTTTPGFTLRLCSLACVVVCSLSAAAPSFAAPDDTKPNEASFEYYVEAPLPKNYEGRWLSLAVSPDVFEHAQPDLVDLRLRTSDGRDVPYALRVREPRNRVIDCPVKLFDRSVGKENASEVSLDLGDDAAAHEHNRVRLMLPGSDYRRHVEVEGGNQPNDWKRMAEGDLFDFVALDKRAHRDEISYPTSRFRYLRVKVYPDPVVDVTDGKPHPAEIDMAKVGQSVFEPGEMIESPASFDPRKPEPILGSPGSRWRIHLAAKNLPVSQLLCEVEQKQFNRDYVIENVNLVDDRPQFDPFNNGVWSRWPEKPIPPLSCPLPAGSPTGELRLGVVDHANMPLNLTDVRSRAAVRELLFANSDELKGPLRLYFGDSRAKAPHYDLERQLPEKFDSPPRRLSDLGAVTKNPEFVPPPVPLTERLPWLIYVVLSVSAVSLTVVLFRLGNDMIQQHDATSATASAEPPPSGATSAPPGANPPHAGENSPSESRD